MTNHCFTLAYNLPSEVQKVTNMLYDMNDSHTFQHHIIDLGFPIVEGDEIPKSFEGAKEINSKKLIQIAKDYSSYYVKMENIGVQQNWTQVYKHLKPSDTDVLIGCDPDEHPLDFGWVKAMGDVIREGNFGMVSLMMPEHIPLIGKIAYNERWVANERVYILPDGSVNWALIGVSGRFFNLMKEMPYPAHAPRYGWIEGSMIPKFKEFGMNWCIMADYKVRHTDFELGDPGTSSLLRLWKNQIIHNIHQYGQLSFEEFLTMKREDRI